MNAKPANVFTQSVSLESHAGLQGKGPSVFSMFSSAYARERREVMSLTDYLEGCRDDPSMYSTAAERMIAAIGEPKVVDTSKDLRLGRIFLNRTIKIYPTLTGFFGMEDTIQRVVSYFQHAAQGLEERKQVLYLLGPVGGGKSSLAERLKHLMESQPFYVLAAGDEVSPIFESPLGLFRPDAMGAFMEQQYKIPARRLTGICSPWAAKRLDQFDGDLAKFSVVKMYPSKLRQVGVARPNPATKTIRTSRRWWARSTSASSNTTRSTIPTPIAIRGASTARRRGCSNSWKCSRRRSRFCTLC
jgi:serine protein kinase